MTIESSRGPELQLRQESQARSAEPMRRFTPSKCSGSLSQGRWTRRLLILPALTEDGSSREGRSATRLWYRWKGRASALPKNKTARQRAVCVPDDSAGRHPMRCLTRLPGVPWRGAASIPAASFALFAKDERWKRGPSGPRKTMARSAIRCAASPAATTRLSASPIVTAPPNRPLAGKTYTGREIFP